MKGWRKVGIYILSIGVAILCSLFMKIDFYAEILDFIGMIAIGFFAGNAGEHIGDALGSRRK